MPGIADAEIWDGRFFAGRQVPFATVLTLTDTSADNDRGQRKKLFEWSQQLRGKNNGCACGHIHCLQVHIEQQLQAVVTHRDLLSLEEIYAVARYYRPGTEQYREVYEIAAFHFPDDVVANVNAASAVMLTGDLTSAWDYLRKVEADPRAWNNLGVLTLMEGDPSGAAVWFRKAVGVEPRKARKNLEIAESYLESDE